ncbi:hypothetical protein B0H12DRAFT_157578 [Mycena haematopus]|nr:hypothetical protein B0H12DRAFT_157578 [Mycena haematopus]
MFFARALLISASFAGLALASPTPNPLAALDARANTDAVIGKGLNTIALGHSVVDALTNLKTANPSASKPVIDSARALLLGKIGGVFPQSLSSSGSALGDCLGGSSSGLAGLEPLLSEDGLDNLLNGVLATVANLLGGLGLDPLLNSVVDLLNSILGASSECPSDQLQDLIDALNGLLGSLTGVAEAAGGCGCGKSKAVDDALVGPLEVLVTAIVQL